MEPAIAVKGLRKTYGDNQVLKGLNFQVERGEIFALLGANGAGKTTTLEIIEGLRDHDAGAVTMNGKAGIQLQSSGLPQNIKAGEAIRLFSEWNSGGIDDAALTRLEIPALKNKQYYMMSTGQKRRLHLALAMIGDPDIIFLDEPTAGLDVEGRLALHEHIRELKARGKTIVLASHDMAEVEDLSDHIAILRDGVIAFDGSVDALTETVGKHFNITVTTDQGENVYETDDIAAFLLTLLERYREEGVTVTDISVDRGTLEQHFIKIAKGD